MWSKLDRVIQRRKFYATLPKKLDQAEKAWHATQPEAMPPPQRINDLHLRAPWHEPKHPGSPK
jgi:hypothetical protein